MRTPIDLTTFLPTVSYWRRGWGLDFIAYVYDENQGSHDEVEVPFESLEHYHRKLPGLLDVAIDWHGRHGYVNYADGVLFLHSIELLENRILSLTDTSGVKRCVAGMRKMPTRDIDVDNIIAIKAFDIKTQVFINEDGDTFTLVTSSNPLLMRFEQSELQKAYPGWEARAMVGQQLGLEGRSLFSYVFFEAPGVQSNVEINDINFG